MSGTPVIPDRAVVASPSKSVVPSSKEVLQRTRTSSAWTGIVCGLVGLGGVMVFVMQNLRPVKVSFVSVSGELPLGILVLLAGALGGLIVFAFGAARIAQLRIQARRVRRSGGDER